MPVKGLDELVAFVVGYRTDETQLVLQFCEIDIVLDVGYKIVSIREAVIDRVEEICCIGRHRLG